MSRLFNYQSFQTFECLDCSTLQTFECRDCSTQSFQTFECLGCLTVTKPRIEHHKWKVEFGAQRGAARQLRSIFGALLLDLHNREDFALALFPGLAQPGRLRPRAILRTCTTGKTSPSRYSQDLHNRKDFALAIPRTCSTGKTSTARLRHAFLS